MILRKLQKADGFSDIEKGLAEYILAHKKEVCLMSIRDLANATFTSTSTILRICRKVGTNGYTEFRMRLNTEIQEDLQYGNDIDENIPFQLSDSFEDISDHIANIYMRGIQETLSLLDYRVIQRIVEKMQNCTCIDIFGEGSSLSSAYEFRNKMLRLGRNVHIEEGHTAQEYQALNCDEHHCAILISHSGENKDTVAIAQLLKTHHVYMIALTADKESTLGRMVNEQIVTGSDEDKTLVTKLETFSSHTSTHFILDCLYCFLYVKNYEQNIQKTKENERLLNTIRNTTKKAI